jgi:hypothetical protein
MTFRNRWLFVAFIIVSIIGLVYQWRDDNKLVATYNFPGELSVKIDTLNLIHVQRHCNCPEWIEGVKRNGGPAVRDYIYLKAARTELILSDTQLALLDSGYLLKAQGSFYEGKGVPDDVAQNPGQKPENARVFRYISSDLIKPE